MYIQPLTRYTVNPHPTWGISPLKLACSMNTHWMNLILYAINGDTGTCPWKVNVNKQ